MKAKLYNSSSCSISVNEGASQSLTTDYGTYEFVLSPAEEISIVSTGRCYIQTINFIGNGVEYSNVDVRIKVATDSFATFLTNNPSVTEYGLEVSTASKTKKYNYATSVYEETKQEKDYQYQVISLGDAINNPSRLEETFTIKAYAKYGDDYYYSTLTKSYSVIDLVEAYYANESTKDMITPLYDLLVSLGKIN